MKLWKDMSLLEQYRCIYSDKHKDAYGFRPRHDTSDWTMEDFLREFAIMENSIDEQADDAS
jgi:hypothetical protein